MSASRRQKQFDRKYSSFRKYTATEDVNYSNHSSRSSYRSESLTDRADSRGRSTSSEVVAGSETRSYPVYIAIQDYRPDSSEVEGIPLEQGQIVEVLDKKNAARWLVRTKARPPQCGWCPGSYFETPTEYYKQRRRTREIEGNKRNMTEEQEAILKRDQVYHDLLRSEEDFVSELRTCVDEYVRALDDSSVPEEIRSMKEKLTLNVNELYNFHANVMLKGLNYYSDDPGKVGQTFVRLERDFDHHVQFYKDLPAALELLEKSPYKEYFQSLSDRSEAASHTYVEHLRNVQNRMEQYTNYFKEFVKYSSRANQPSKSMQKALELTMSVPQRVRDLVYTNNITSYPGDTGKIGRLIRHDLFKVDEGDGLEPKERYVFLFKNKIMITDKVEGTPAQYNHYASIRLDKYSIRPHTTDEDTLILKPSEPGLPSFTMKPVDLSQSEYIRKAWVRDIAEEHEEYAAQKVEFESATGTTEFDVRMSDAQSEFSEYSSSRKSSLPGPEEGGPPRKKIKSPPVISPTGSSTSLYSGGSSSIDWTTTGTTLEMQGTRVTRTQYGFRTLQESSAKMCLKVTGYPLPDITWYKDDVLLHEDERHTFYADEDGFFAMTIDPVQVDDTGRYTCMATNEYGQASTSAFFRVLKVEKEAAPPAFVNKLKDQECQEGDVVNFECEVEGWPEPELLWLVDDQPLRPSHDFKLQYDGQTAKLEIRDAQPDDTGVYTVKIQNEFGTCESKAELVVQPDPDKNHVEPEFQATIEDVECNEGDEVRFKAVYTGDPTPEISWTINGIPITESEKIRFISEDGICIITIKDVTRHFDGIVTCHAANRLGTTTCDGRLKVRVPPAPPTFNKPLEDKVVQENNNAVFEVDVSGWPEPNVVFTLKGKELKHGVDGVEILASDGYFRVVINNCKLDEHDGEIIARATNEHGTAESRARLTVEPPEEESRSAPTFIKDIEDQTVKEGEFAVFETTVKGNPNPEVSWFINGHKMDDTSPGIKIEVINHDHKLTIDSASYAGTVLCRAENSVGRFETKARLIVIPQEPTKKPPQFTERLVDKTETEQNTVVFEVRAEGYPKPTVRWFLNGSELTTSDSRVEIREFEGSYKLELKNLSTKDSGEIKCVAENSEGKDECSAKLTVNRKPFAPVFDESPKNQTVTKEEKAEFRAHADAMPPAQYTWSVDGRKIRESTEGCTIREENGVSILVIDTVIHNSATVSVIAENSLGMDETGARLTVNPKVEPIETVTAAAETTTVTREEESVTSETKDTVTQEITVEPIITVTAGEAVTAETKDTVTQEITVEPIITVTAAEAITAETKDTVTQEITVEPIITVTAAEAFTAESRDTVVQEGTIVVEPIITTTAAATSESVTSESKDIVVQEGTIVVEPMGVASVTETHTTTKTTTTTTWEAVAPGEEPKYETTVVTEQTTVVKEHAGAEEEPKLTVTEETATFKSDEVVGAQLVPSQVTFVEQGKATVKTKETVIQEGTITVEPITTTSTTEAFTAESRETVTQEGTIVVEPITAVAKDEPKVEVEAVTVTATDESRVETQQVTTEEKVAEAVKVTAELKDTVTPAGEVEPKLEKELEKPVEQPKMNGDVKPEPEIVQVEKPRITRELQSQTVTRGDLAHFEIVVENATEVQWKHNETVLTSSTNGVKISQDDKFEFRLSLDSAIFNEGTISITASNSAGSVSSSCNMKVLEVPKETHKPEFTDKLRDLEVTRGDSTRMDVIALHSPEYKWFINNQLLEDGKNGVRIITEENKSSLIIDNFQDFHNGPVRVEASNEVGTSESTATLRLLEPAVAPRITDGPTYQDIKEGETAEFKATVTGVPAPTVKWCLNEKLIEESSTVSITSSGEEHILRIKETTVSQTGKVQITAQNSAGSDQRIVELKIAAVHFKPEFTATLSDKTVNEGEPLRWDLRVSKPSPDTVIQWFLNGQELKPDDNVQIADHGDGSYHLTIAEAKPEMSGTITAKCKNPAGECETSAKVQVNPGDKRPEFTKTPQNHETYVDESIKFSAIVTGTPVPQVSWFLNGTKLENSEEIKVKHESDTGKTSIRIHKPKIANSGDVKVVAENSAGKVEATATLKVEIKPEVPKFTSNMDDRQVNEGDTVKFTSTIEGFPAPQVEWTLNGEPVSKYPNIKVSDEGNQHTIEITQITPEQAGELSCQASNAVGLKKQNVILAVKMVGDAPTFAKNLEDQLVTEGEITVMECKMPEGVKPKPKITWYKDGQELQSGEHWKLEEREEGVYRLKIVETKMEDKGRITIKAENHFGSAECAASLGVTKKRPMAKPAFQSEIVPITLTEGDSLQTKLLITGDPTPFVKWYINNTMVCETEDTEIKNANGVYSLTIHGVTSDMSGKIKCTAYNKAGEVTTEGPLKVVKPIPVEFETSLCDATCREGDTLKLKAVLLGEPTPVVSWYVNGKKLEESQNIKIHAEKGTYTVTIKDITCDYSGKVVCEAVNEYGTASSSAMLLVLPRGEPPDFLEWLSNVRARQGTKVVHKVVFTGDPKPTLTWFINNREVVHGADGGDITIVTDEKTSILTINSFNPDVHVGEIICKAENDAGEVSCTANMATYTSDMFSESESEAQIEEFVGEDMTGTDEESLREEIHRTPTPVMAPKFITKIKDTKAKKGHEAIFECVVPDTKGVCCKWLKDGKEIELIARIRVQSRTIEGHITQELIIDDVQPEDAGKYTVVVENSAGREVCEASLTVLEDISKPDQKAPEFLVALQDKKVKTSEKVVFECKVDGEPKPTVQWYHEDKIISESGNIVIESIQEVQRLTINSSEVAHQGAYSCVAQNTAGTTKTEAKLSVEAQAPVFTKELEDRSVSIGEKLTIMCSVKGQPQPHVDFYQRETKLVSDSRISIEHDATNTHWRCVVQEMKREEFGEFRAVATNQAGSATSTCRVEEKTTAPVFEQGLKKTSVKEKEEIRMEVKVSGTSPDVEFFKDGAPVDKDANHDVIKNPEQGTFTLVVKEAALSDAGTYSVKATNPAGTVESSAETTVEQLLEAPKFTKELASTEIKISDNATLSVTVKGVPAPEVQWFKDDEPVTADGSHIISKKISEEEYSLTINSINSGDAGSYSCKAVNKAGEAKTDAQVTVAQALEAPAFTKELVSTQIKISETATLSVSVKGVPAPEVNWFKDGTPVSVDGSHIVSKKISEEEYSLTINSVNTGDAGSYSCKAVNKAGEATTDAQVTITEALEAPRFTKELVSTQINVSESATLSVSVKGVPAPEVQWFKDDKPVTADGSHIISKKISEEEYSLTINSVNSGDAGSYSCKAVNKAGEAKTDAQVTVSQALEAPTFTKELVSTHIKISETATLSVSVKGVPAPEVNWFKDGTPVYVDGSHIVSKKISEEEYSLTINSANSGDAGSYSCKAVNKAGEAKTEAQVTITEALEAPRFVKELASTEVKVSESATLSITVKGVPAPQVQWFKDDKPVSADGSHIISKKISEEEYSLTINSARLEDAGRYSCKAVNKAGEAETQANFAVVKTIDAPQFTENLQPMEVKETETLNMSVTVTGTPEPKVTWFRDGQPVQIDNVHAIAKSDESGHHSLTIKDARTSDVGNYSCKATNEAGEATSEAKMGVVESVEAPHFTEGLKPLDAEEGKPLELRVTVEGKPEPEVTFTKDGVPINMDKDHEIKKDSEGHHTLVIRGVTASDVGSYSCKAVNKVGQDVTLGEIRIPKYSFEKAKEEEVQPLFVEPLHETSATEGETVVLTCKVNKESKPEIKFYRDDKPVDLGPHMVLDVTDDGSIKLTINNATKEDVGAYRCEAVNKAGAAKTTAELKLQYATEGQVTVADEQDHLETLTEEAAPKMESVSAQDVSRGAPEFIELLRSCTVAVQQQAVLKCKVKGEPRPKIKWTRDGKEVEMSARIKTDFKEDGTLTLTIDKAEQQDAGEYRCFAENELGSAWTEGPIIVTLEGAPVPSGDAPDFIQPVRPVVVDEGETAVLEGKISGKPRPTVKWYKNGTEMTSDDRVKIESLEDGTQRITVKDARMDDMDEYRCEASNEYGDVWSDVTLTVKEKIIEAPAFTKELKAQSVVEGKPVEFECKVTGLPKSEVKWFKDGEELKQDTRIHFQSQEDGTEKLLIDKSKVEDQGNYRVEITNPGGQESSKAPLTVEGADTLKIKKGLQDIETTRGNKIILSVEVEGKPKTVKWYKGTENVVSDRRTKIEKVSDAVFHLEVENTELTDSGSYRVVLSTESESVESSCKVTIIDTAAKEHIPVFKKGLNDQQVPKGTPLVLEVEIDGLPKSVKWYKNGDELKGEDLGNGKYRLTVPDFNDSDVGDYCVVASNEVGEVESRAKVTVEPTGGDGKPEIVSGLVPTTVAKGETAVFTVKTKGPVKGVKWYKNGKEIEQPKTKDLGDGVYQLEIPNADKEDAADYKVVVSNDAGDADSGAALTVKLPGEGPKIVSGLVPTTVSKGETATFSVKVAGPVKQVKWYKNGKEIEQPKTKDLGDGVYQLEVPNADKDDAADYKVVVSNDAGDADSGAALTVKLPGEGPKIVSGLVPTTVSKGETATFSVKVAGPVKQVKWYKNGKEIEKPKTKDLGDGEHQLEIPNAGDEDAADYKVVVSNDDGTADSSAALTVKLPAGEAPKIVSGLVPTTVKKGDTATFSVKVAGPVKQVKWYKNGKEIEKPKTKDIGDGEHQLEIPNAADDDAADYKVVVSNDDGSADSSAALTVKLPGEAPKIVSGLVPTTVNQGETATFRVKVAGPIKQVKWYKNGKELEKPKTKDLGDGTYELEIPDAQENDIADYKVVLSNDDGSADSSAALTVKLPPKDPQLTFLKPLKDLEVTEGEDAEFRVETNAKPKSVKWYKNGQEIKPDARVATSEDGTVYKLVISKTIKDDAAKYSVTLSNDTGSVDSSASLTVKKPLAPAPKILKGLEDQVVAKGAALVFEVKVEGLPEEVKWTKDGAPVTAGANAVIEKIDDQTYRLTIPKADIADAGHYAVELSNTGGKVRSEANGEVDEKPEIVKGLDNLELQTGDDDVFKVEVSAPVRTVKWYKNGQEIKPDRHMEPKKIGPKKYELAINKAALDDTATYKVVLGNAAGECDSEAALTVTKPNILKILEGLKDVDVLEGQPIDLKVKVEGIPKTVKWYKNGQELSPSAALQISGNADSGEYTLSIPSSQKNDGAAYRVVLANEKGEIYSGSVVYVKAAKPTTQDVGANFLSPLQDTEVEEGDTLTLKCTVGGTPFPSIIWEKDGVELKKDDRIVMREAMDGTVTLRIRDVRKSDFGQYRVTATNDAGSATSACQVTVTDKGEEKSKPHFIIPLKSCEAAPGDKKEFSVKLRGFPRPTLEWFLNGNPLQLDDRITVEDLGDGNFCLTIKDVQASDYGTIRCIAKNEMGQDECQAEFEESKDRLGREKDDDRYPPRFNVPLWDRHIPVNDPLSIECHVDARPTADIEWFKDGIKLVTNELFEIRNSTDGACRLRIHRFTQEETGVYVCKATNELGQADTRATYSVEVVEEEQVIRKKEYAPKFNPGLMDQTVNAGQGIRLSCVVDAVPKAAVTWYKDGLPLRSDSRTTIEYSEDGTCTLQIKDALAGDEGAYRCVATNEHGTINTSCLVTVKVPKTVVQKEGEEPFFTKGLVDVWTDRGETFTLRCAVKGDPFPEIKWYRNGQLVRNGPRTIIETTPEGECIITVKDCTMADEGTYRCEAENKHGKAKTQATAHVQMAIGKGDKPKVEEGQAPRFIIPLEDATVIVGGVIDLECKVTGQPMPQVKWSKDGGPIWEDPRYEWDIDEAKGTYSLRIRNATVNEEGTYRCVATNESGSATTKSFIRIDDGLMSAVPSEKSAPPRFAIKLGDARAVEGQPLKFECKIEGFPLPELTWHKDGAQIHPSDRVQLSMDPDGTARLVIPSCTMDDDGIYRVIAKNPSGSAHDKGTATVKRAPKDTAKSPERDTYDINKAPKVLEQLENVRVPEKDRIHLRCKFSGDPKPSIKWFKDGERVFPYGRLQLKESPDGTCELIIDSSARQDAGGYRCVAENTYGSARTSCDVNVIPKERKPRDIMGALASGKAPGFTIPLTIKRAKPGADVTFECLPYGTPFPNIKWLKDGIELIADEKYKMESAEDGTQRLTLHNVDFFSEGYFRCVATNEHGTASTKAELVIEGERGKITRPAEEIKTEPDESKPRIRRGLHNMSIHQGNTVEMIVCATGWPTPTVKWFKDGEEIISDGAEGRRVIFTDERGIHHLVILNTGPDDEGEYSLEATNKLGSARTEGALNIIRPRLAYDGDDRGGMPFPPGFVRQLKNKHVFNRMPTIFDCLVVGHPAPEVEWFHNGKKITPGGRVKIQSCGGGSHAIIILDTTTDDAGEYVAIAKNCHGTASSSAILDVTVPHLDSIKFNGEIDVTPYLTEEYGFKKVNYASLPTPPDRGPFIKEVTGHYLTLSWIPTKRAPPRYPQVSYCIEIRELPEKEWTLLDYNIPEPVCKVRNLELGKSYQFRVRAENIYGISDPSPASPPSRLMAPPQPVLDKRTKKIIPLLDPYAERALDQAHAQQYSCAPWFAPGVIDKRYCAENDTLTIILNVSGYPDPQIQWKFRGWDIDTTSPTSKCKVYTYGGTETTLAISGFSKENVGQYQCFAKNEYGEAQQNIMVELATRPSFIQPLMDKTFSSAHPLKLDVRVDGQPFPELKWMKDWRPLVESSRVKFVQDGPYLCSLIINDPLWRDSGIYSCMAINEAGQATTSCTVTVEADGDYNDVELPKKRVGIEARKVREIYEIEEEDEQ